jgi:dTDP-L-rhamnose 4-epimerase
MRVLLTGAAGFIGSAVAERLLDAGHEVVGVDALIPQAHAPGSSLPDGTVRADIRDPDVWPALLRGVDVVCHQAAMVGAGVRVGDIPDFVSHNDLGTGVLLAAMAAAGVGSLVLASSMVVYGEGRYSCPDHGVQAAGPRRVEDLDAGRFDPSCRVCGGPLGWELVDEDARLDPRSSYAASKVAQEHYAASWARQAPGRAIALRYHNVYGPRMPRDTPYSGVAAIFRSRLEAGLPPDVFEDGEQMRDFVHVRDAAAANVRACEAVADGSATEGTFAAYNVCSGAPIRLRDVATTLSAASGTGLAPVVSGRYRLGDVRHIVASPRRAAAELGFSAEIGPQAGITAFAHDPLR